MNPLFLPTIFTKFPKESTGSVSASHSLMTISPILPPQTLALYYKQW
jgi:hypothetical protein